MNAEQPKDSGIFCAVPWPACPACIGQFSIVSTGGTDTCRGCGRTWPTAANAVCGRAATYRVVDSTGGSLCVCDAHAALARRQVVDATVMPFEE